MKKRIKFFISFLLCFVINNAIFSQNKSWQWSKSVGGTENEFGQVITTDLNGNIYAAGTFFSSTITLGNFILTNSSPGKDVVFIVKYNPSGDVLWAKQSGASSNCNVLSISVKDNLVIAGQFSDTISFGGISLYSSGEPCMNAFVVQYDIEGNELWAKKYSGIGYCTSTGIAFDDSGNTIISGYFQGQTVTFGDHTLTNTNPPYSDIFIVKYSSTGTVSWAKKAGGTLNDDSRNIAIDNMGNVLLTGAFASQLIQFENYTLINTNPQFSDFFVVKYNNSGQLLWANSSGGVGHDIGTSIALDQNGSVFVTGGFSDIIIFENDTIMSAGDYDLFLVKFNNMGSMEWAKSAGGTGEDFCYRNKTTPEGNTYLLGYFSSSNISFANGILTNESSGTPDVLVLCFDSNGNEIFGKSAGGTQLDVGQDITIDIQDNVFITGNFYSDFITFGNNNPLINNDNCDAFIAKLAESTDLTAISGTVKNAIVDLTSGSIEYPPFPNVIISLYENGSLISSTTTDTNGDFLFSNLNGTSYTIVAAYTGSYIVQSRYENQQPGTVLGNIKLPYYLMGQVKALIAELETQEFDDSVFYNLINYSLTTSGYDETAIESTLTTYSHIFTNHQAVVETLGRLYIAQRALSELSNDARTMSAEIAVSTFELGESIFNLFTLKKKLFELTGGIENYQLCIDLIEGGFNYSSEILEAALIQGCNYINDDNIRAYTIAILQAVFDALRVQAEGGDLNDWELNSVQNAVRKFLCTHVAAKIYSNLFITTTQQNVDITASNALALNFEGSFSDAYNLVLNNISNTSIVETGNKKTLEEKDAIKNLRNLSQASSTAGQIASITAIALTLTGFGSLANLVLQPLIIACKTLEVSTAGWAVAKGADRLNGIKIELQSATNQSFSIYNMNNNVFSPNLNQLTSVQYYNATLDTIKLLVQNDQRQTAINTIRSLMRYDSILQIDYLTAISPIYATMNKLNGPEFQNLLENVVVRDFSWSMQTRQAVNFALATYLLDSISNITKTTIENCSMEAIDANNKLSTSIDSVNTILSGTYVPAYVSVTSSTKMQLLAQSTIYPLKVSFKNNGSTTIENLCAIIELQDGFTTTQDSIFIGNLISGAVDSIEFYIATPNYDTTSFYSIIFKSPNSASVGYGKALKIRNGNGNKVDAIQSANNLICFPNPANQYLCFWNSKTDCEYAIIDLVGKTLKKGIAINGKNQINIEGLTSGIYILKVENSCYFSTAKFIVQ